jgi:IclR family acetate operon transcriptional repressor
MTLLTMPDAPDDLNGETAGVRSVRRSLRIVELLASGRSLRVSEIAPIVQLSKSTAQRALRTLEEAGWVRQAESTSWEIDPRVRLILRTSVPDEALRRAAAPAMRALRDATGETIHLTVPAGPGIVEIAERLDTAHELRSVLPVGSIFPSHEVAAGIAIEPELEVADAVRGNGWVRKLSPTGHSVGIAAAVRDPRGVAVAALVVVVPIARWNPVQDDVLGAAAHDAAAGLSRDLGGG